MRIAFFLPDFPMISQTFILNQISGLIARGHEVDIFALHRVTSGESHPDVIRYSLADRAYYVPDIPKSKFARLLKGLSLGIRNFPRNPQKILKAFNVYKSDGRSSYSITPVYLTVPFLERGMAEYDIIQCHFGDIGNWAAVLRRKGIITGKIVTMFHGYDIRRGIRDGGDIYCDLKKEGDCFLSISPYNRRHLQEFGFPEERIIHHPVGIDTSFFGYHRNGTLRHDDEIRILSVARLVPEKGLKSGIAAMGTLARTLPDRKITYRILGSGALEKELRAYAEELGLQDVVIFLGEGNSERVKEELQDADIFFLPSRNEALPVSVMEALASGLPVVASDVGSVRELVKDGISGFVLPSGDADAFAGRLEELVRQPEVRLQMGRAGRAHIEAEYDINVLNDRLIEVYRRLVREADGSEELQQIVFAEDGDGDQRDNGHDLDQNVK